jgi:serine/alanine adding enzyme
MPVNAVARPAAEMLEVEEYTGSAVPWDGFVGRSVGSSFCHLAAWREVMDGILGHRCRYAVARDARGEWQGVLPLVHVRSRLLGSYLLSMPFLNYGGPLGTPAARTRLAEHAQALAGQAGVTLLELRTRHAVPASLATCARKVTVTLPLPAAVEELWQATFRAKLRSQIRRPLKEGMEVRFGADQAGPFYEVFARHMRDLGTPVLTRRLFECLPRLFPEHAVFGCVWHGTVPVAAGCGFLWAGEFEMTWASSLREYSRSAPNMLLYAGFMEEMVRRGVPVFNFGRCTPGGGTHRFKLQWGGTEEPLPWAQWSPDGTAATPSPDRPLFQLATRAWQRLPLGVANRAGPVLARRLP